MFNPKEILNQLHAKLQTSYSPNENMIDEVFNGFFPMNSEDNKYTIHYISSRLDGSNYKIPNPQLLFATAPLYAKFRLENKTSNEISENEVLLGDSPYFY